MYSQVTWAISPAWLTPRLCRQPWPLSRNSHGCPADAYLKCWLTCQTEYILNWPCAFPFPSSWLCHFDSLSAFSPRYSDCKLNGFFFFYSFYSSLGHISGQSPHLVLSISEFPVISVLSFFSTFCVLVAASVNCWLSPYVSRVDSLQEKIWLVWLIFLCVPIKLCFGVQLPHRLLADSYYAKYPSWFSKAGWGEDLRWRRKMAS